MSLLNSNGMIHVTKVKTAKETLTVKTEKNSKALAFQDLWLDRQKESNASMRHFFQKCNKLLKPEKENFNTTAYYCKKQNHIIAKNNHSK